MTILSDDVADLRSGKLTLDQLTNKWIARDWSPVYSPARNVLDVSSLELDEAVGGDGTWHEVVKMRLAGQLSPDEFRHISSSINAARGRTYPPYTQFFQQIADTAQNVRSIQQTAHARHLAVARKQTIHSGAIGHRQPTKVEAAARTDFKTIQMNWQSETNLLLTKWDAVRAAQIDELTQQIADAVDANDTDALAGILADTTGADIIAEHMKSMMEQSVVTAKAEAAAQGVAMQTLDTSDLARQLEDQASAIADIMNRGISNSAATQALMRYGVDDLSGAEVSEAVRGHLEDLSGSYLNDMLGGALTQAQNQGRMFVMDQAPGEYYSSELLDENTCEFCEAVDGTDYPTIEAANADYPMGGYSECAGGPRCRGTIVAVYDEATTDQSSDDTTDATPADDTSVDSAQ